jgi:hypothetical protein
MSDEKVENPKVGEKWIFDTGLIKLSTVVIEGVSNGGNLFKVCTDWRGSSYGATPFWVKRETLLEKEPYIKPYNIDYWR